MFKRKKYWITPGADILNDTPEKAPAQIYDGASMAQTLTALGLSCKHVKTVSAPQIVTYHFDLVNLAQLGKVKKTLEQLSALVHLPATQAKSSIAHFAVVVPQMQRRTVYARDVILTKPFNTNIKPLLAGLGCDLNNNAVVLNVADMPHMLIAGATGSGKSVLLNSIICSLLFHSTPADARFIMIDPKKVELTKYEGLPHLFKPVIKDAESAVTVLSELCDIMDGRYDYMAQNGKKTASELGLPSIVVVIDELADLMLTSRYECEKYIVRLAQLGRAAGIHLIIATQRPTVNVITGLIKANIPCRIALQTASVRDSMNILDHKGAETLTGKGDALLKLPDAVNEIRFQSAYISSEDIENIVDYWKHKAVTYKA